MSLAMSMTLAREVGGTAPFVASPGPSVPMGVGSGEQGGAVAPLDFHT